MNYDKNKKTFFQGNLIIKLFYHRVSLREKLFFTQYLRLMIKSGVSLSAALNTLAKQSTNKYFSHIVRQTAKNIESGSSFTESLRYYDSIFGELYINMIEAGEASGRLEDVLEQLYVEEKKQYELTSKLKTATAYPLVIILSMIGVCVFLMIYVLPVLTGVFMDLNAELPLPTRLVIGFSNFFLDNGIIIFIALFLIASLAISSLKQREVKLIFEKILFRLPFISSVIKKLNLARFSRSLSTLLKTDIPIIRSFEITANTLGNLHYRRAVMEMSEKIKKGSGISEALASYPAFFPPVVQEVMMIGEETGSLDNILLELADFYESEIRNLLNDLPSVIEPVLIVILGLGVALIATAIVMPIYGLAEIM
jgi:type IV pilus assembly protein PilC